MPSERDAATVPGSRVSVVWFRRDLRVHDHPALAEAIRSGARIAPLFVLDPALLHGRFASPNRTWFLLGSLRALSDTLEMRGSRLSVRIGRASDVVPAFARDVGASEVVVSRDYAPAGRARDGVVATRLARAAIGFRACRGLLIHEPDDVLTADGRPFTRFAPFHRRWRSLPMPIVEQTPTSIPTAPRVFLPGIIRTSGIPDADAIGVPRPTADPAAMPLPGEPAARTRMASWLDGEPGKGIARYADTRDDLANAEGTSRLGADLRFGLLSPVEVATRALGAGDGAKGPDRFVSELAWRDFYAHALWHEPRTAREPHVRRFIGIDWPGSQGLDEWRAGRTGYPIVDAAMRQLMTTGGMPNRARMIVASFLTKDLLVDWREGEAWFMTHLLDGDPASNLGGWQWAASVGIDALPSFRVFNPVIQGERFDPDGVYVRRWLPELSMVPTSSVHAPWMMSSEEQTAARCRIGRDYPARIVDHAEARARAIAWFAALRDTR
ncbi:MAG: cryptochrome/photolyase family protein [Chloroflexota bacterium]|jgi:deoxyribodipyrimidine photo-lyase